MYNSKICVIASLLFLALFTQSCQDDFTNLSSDNFTTNSENPEQRPKPKSEKAEIATSWMNLFLELDRYATGMRPNATARALAYINLAAYETALPVLSGYESNQILLENLEIAYDLDERKLNPKIALNKTYALVIDHFLLNLPDNQRARINQFYQEMATSDLNSRDQGDVQESLDWAEYVSTQIINYAASDSTAEVQILSPQPTSYEPPLAEGYWTYSAGPERALFPYWSKVRTFVVSTDQTTSLPPLEYSEEPNSPYHQQMMEVYRENNRAKIEDNEELWIAEFWSDDVENLVFSPPARQISIATQIALQKKMKLGDALYLYLKLGFALNDAAVSTWKYKYEHMVMRPSVYIQTKIDPTYQTNLYRLIPWPNPTFPAYPSGHSTFASAAAGVFIAEFGDEIQFTDESHIGRTEFRGKPRKFRSFSQMADENGYSRIPLGVHMRMDCTEGLRLGYEISELINAYNLKKQPL